MMIENPCMDDYEHVPYDGNQPITKEDYNEMEYRFDTVIC